MYMTPQVEKILQNYDSDNPGVRANLCRMLMHGKLGGTGKMIILPVDQGFEHGPARSFAVNPAAYDPLYHFELAIEGGLNAYAAPLGMLEVGSAKYAGLIPTILKINSANSLLPKSHPPFQAITASVHDALRLGCVAIGFTIYPGSSMSLTMLEHLTAMAQEAKSYGLAVVIWSYPRGEDLNKDDETALDVCAYAAHMAALIGAHIIKVKPPTSVVSKSEAAKFYQTSDYDTLSKRIRHVKQACFDGRRIVIFSGGANKTIEDVYDEAREISAGGGNGSIIGRNTFQRPKQESLDMLSKLIEIYKAS